LAQTDPLIQFYSITERKKKEIGGTRENGMKGRRNYKKIRVAWTSKEKKIEGVPNAGL
jgi:hypothetical protein